MGHPGRTLLRFSILFPYLALLALSSFTAADDAAVMAKLLAALNPAPSGWSASIDPCNWKDVTCLSGRVTNINLFSQSLSGTLPSDLGSLTQLTVLSLQGNSFSGPIPSLANLSLLQQLYLDNNKFTSIPAGFFQGLTSLQILTLSANAHLEPWTIPIELTQARSLVILYASGASVVGPLPDVFDSFPSLNDLRLSNNNLTGTLPKSLGGSAIQNLSLDNQVIGLSGTIDVLSSMTQLSRAWLQYNQFTGAIPDSLATLPSLRLLYLANNNLTGPIPKFATTVEFTSSGNPLLETTTASSGRGGEASISAGTIAGIVIAVVIFAMVVLFLSIKCYVGRRHKKYGSVENPENEKEGSGDLSDLHVFEGGNVTVSIQVLRQATNNFSEENILGKGGFGVVYKGELQDGTKIAVKKMEIVTDGSRGVKEFRAEISVLTKVRHKHLVALLGYCVNGNERLLVYEYMPRGNLSHHLFGWHERGYTSLTWKQRVTIALDVARGLEYLHSSTQQSFIHRDLKPSNILLGDDMRAKVSDFGLVKNLPDGNHSLETRLAGTFGYLAPEYGETGRVTTKTDVYAFGVVLTVLITGKKAVLDSGLDEKSHLVTWFLEVLKEKEDIPKAIDQTLDLDEETMESIHKVIELAGHCTARSPSERPNMGHAVSILSPLVEQWKPSCQEVKKSHSFDLTFKPSSSFTQTESSIESFGSMQPR